MFPPWDDDEPIDFFFPFAVSNLSAEPHEVLITFDTTAGWPLTSPPPASVPLAGGASANLLVGFQLPVGTPEGASNLVSVTAELAGVPGSVSTTVSELVLTAGDEGPDPVPALVGAGVLAGAIGLLASGWVVLRRLRR